MTYSITAVDHATGRWGVAVQSCVFAVGTRVPAVRRDAGALAVQAGAPAWYRRPGLDMLSHGLSAGDVVAALTGLPGAGANQFAVVDSAGRVAAHTGDACIAAAGHRLGHGVVTAANLVERPGMWDEMMRAYETAHGPFEARLLAALSAGESAGGDVRGRQSAALLVCAAEQADGRLFETDIRVDDAVQPVAELRRLWAVKAAHDQLRHALPEGGAGNWDAAAARLAAAGATVPDDIQVTLWAGIALALAGRTGAAAPYLGAAAERNARLPDYLAREPLLAEPADRDLVIRLMSTAAERPGTVEAS